jgi:DNA-binding transcriptional MerR regulator
MLAAGQKDPGALLTIGELSQELGVAQHILRYWESRFPQLRPMQRAGNRRYYRPADVELARRIHRLLNQEGYTVRGVQKLLRDRSEPEARPSVQLAEVPPSPPETIFAATADEREERPSGVDVFRLIALRNRLADALES